MVVAASRVIALPPHADVGQLAMLRINPPAAGLMLSEFVDLEPGDWILQNADPNSGVGGQSLLSPKASRIQDIESRSSQRIDPRAGGSWR